MRNHLHRTFSLGLISLLFLVAGVSHFVRPQPFVDIVPSYLPQPLLLVWISGFFEILGGLGVLLPRVRRWAGWGLNALLLAVLPANIYMMTDHPYILQTSIPHWILVLRLPLQFLLMVWIFWATNPKNNGVG